MNNLLKRELQEIKAAIDSGEYQLARDILAELGWAIELEELAPILVD